MEPAQFKARLFKENPLERVLSALMTAAGGFTVLMICAGAIMRYVFRKDIYGAEELVTIAAFWMYFAGGVYASKTRQQISADMLGVLIKNRKARYLAAVAQRIVTLALSLICAWWGIQFLYWSVIGGGKTNLWQIPLWVGQASVCLGFLAMLAYHARDLVWILKAKASDFSPDTA